MAKQFNNQNKKVNQGQLLSQDHQIPKKKKATFPNNQRAAGPRKSKQKHQTAVASSKQQLQAIIASSKQKLQTIAGPH